MKILVIGSYANSLINFRGSLLKALVQNGHEVIGCASGYHEKIVEQLSRMGVKYQRIKIDRTGLNPIKDIISFLHLWYIIYILRPDIILNYTIKPIIYGSLSARLVRGNKCFSMIEGLGYIFSGESLKQKFLRILITYLYRLALRSNKSIFFLNPDDLEFFINEGLLTEREKAVLINGAGADIKYFKKVPVVSNPIIFLLIARLIKEKGIIEYVEAARILKRKYNYVSFRLVGSFDVHPSSIRRNVIERWRQEGIIEFLPEVEDVRPYIADSSVYVLPSYREGIPRTILEAMAMGRPIITTDVPGCRETVIDGENGFLVPVKDVNALVQAMEYFILQPESIEKMGNRSREIAEEKYDVHKVNAVILKTMGLHNEKAF